jgi:hypothetical protein
MVEVALIAVLLIVKGPDRVCRPLNRPEVPGGLPWANARTIAAGRWRRQAGAPGLAAKPAARQGPAGEQVFGWLASVHAREVEEHEVGVELEQDVVRDVEALVRRSTLPASQVA